MQERVRHDLRMSRRPADITDRQRAPRVVGLVGCRRRPAVRGVKTNVAMSRAVTAPRVARSTVSTSPAFSPVRPRQRSGPRRLKRHASAPARDPWMTARRPASHPPRTPGPSTTSGRTTARHPPAAGRRAATAAGPGPARRRAQPPEWTVQACRCPIPAGEYVLAKATTPVRMDGVPPGPPDTRASSRCVRCRPAHPRRHSCRPEPVPVGPRVEVRHDHRRRPSPPLVCAGTHAEPARCAASAAAAQRARSSAVDHSWPAGAIAPASWRGSSRRVWCHGCTT